MGELSKKAKAKITETFESNEAVKSFHATVDGQCFTIRDAAYAHEGDLVFAAQTDVDKEAARGVFEVKREDYVSEEKVEGKQPKMVKHIVTAEDLEKNPELAEAGVKEGDEIEIPEPK